MSNFDAKIDEKFGIASANTEEEQQDKDVSRTPQVGDVVEDKPKEVEVIDGGTPIRYTENKDYEYARTNIYSAIEEGISSMRELGALAQASDSARTYEVLANLIRTVVEANKDLVKMGQEKKRTEMEEEARREMHEERKEEPQNVTNNNLFIGSTSELQKMLKEFNGENTDKEKEE